MLSRALKIGRTVPIENIADAYYEVPRAFIKMREFFRDQADFRIIDNSGPIGSARVYYGNGRELISNETKAQLEAQASASWNELYRQGKIPEAIYRAGLE
jgi:hypothetical protein